MANKSGKGFLLNTGFYKSAKNAAILVPDRRKQEGEAAIQPEGTAAKKKIKQQKQLRRVIFTPMSSMQSLYIPEKTG